MRTIAVALALSLAAAASPAQQHHERAPDDPFTLKPLAGNVHALYGRGGNVGFYVGPDAVVVVDSQFKDLAPGIVAKIKSVTDKPIKYLVNPARVEAARKAGNDAQVKQLSEQIDWAKNVKVEEIPAPVLTFDSELRIHGQGIPRDARQGDRQDAVERHHHPRPRRGDGHRGPRAAGTPKDDFVKQVDLPAYKAFSGYPDRFRANAAAAFAEAP